MGIEPIPIEHQEHGFRKRTSRTSEQLKRVGTTVELSVRERDL